ncbi:hypothetical protein [Candidatus Laterigemmans baculatus]|uniref:hypothetical protein n=1 Tax=Candidatus Laterigemmans baculatus TaxID=2770505 RepID=UPI0013DCC6FE|nr:hypothetical protein [Candidatus Laterigemmans baculatus]
MHRTPPLLKISPRITALPIIHGSGQCALLVRRWMLEHDFDCVAVPLPESFREPVEQAVLELPNPSIVIQPGRAEIEYREWNGEPATGMGGEYDEEDEEDERDSLPLSYVPIDPCQPVIMGIRAAMGEHIPRAYIDLDTDRFLPLSASMPDPYALRQVSPERFAAALLPGIPKPPDRQSRDRIVYMARQLRELEKTHARILVISSVLQWPWLREAYREADALRGAEACPEPDPVERPVAYELAPRSLMFLFGELPFITGLYERARAELEDDENLSVDGVKELLVAARDAYRADLGKRARRITPLLLSQCLKYIRNLSLLHRRMTPDLYTIVTASKQILGDQFALHVVETARSYPYEQPPLDAPRVTLGIDQARLPDGEIVPLVSRLAGPATTWQTVELQRRPTSDEQRRWRYQWNPLGQCSYPPEDSRIERFRTRVFDRARAITGADLARTEKFTTSVKDGIDIRDTLRHWYEGEIYVKVIPPDRGSLDACVMLFDSPADPRDYPWRTTWFAEHEEESTLAFYASDFRREVVGPGICLANYGGAMFLYPPRMIHDIWNDRRLDFAETLEERLLAAACMHGRSRQVALLSWLPPGAGWRRLARRFRKQLVHVPLSAFSDAEVSQLRMVHVLNGTHVRSYAEHFIRKA